MKKLTAEEALDLVTKFDQAVSRFKGNSEVLESAIGTYFVARNMGWKVALLMHNVRTIKKYEEITGISFRDGLDPETPLSKKSVAYDGLKRITNFWKAVKGEIPGAKSMQVK